MSLMQIRELYDVEYVWLFLDDGLGIMRQEGVVVCFKAGLRYPNLSWETEKNQSLQWVVGPQFDAQKCQ